MNSYYVLPVVHNHKMQEIFNPYSIKASDTEYTWYNV